MSILQKQTIIEEKTIQELKAESIINSAVNLTKIIIGEWKDGIDALWDDQNPQAVLDAMGTDANEVFELSDKIIQLLSAVIPESIPEEWSEIQKRLDKIKPFVINEDGSVTVIVEEDPEEDPYFPIEEDPYFPIEEDPYLPVEEDPYLPQ